MTVLSLTLARWLFDPSEKSWRLGRQDRFADRIFKFFRKINGKENPLGEEDGDIYSEKCCGLTDDTLSPLSCTLKSGLKLD